MANGPDCNTPFGQILLLVVELMVEMAVVEHSLVGDVVGHNLVKDFEVSELVLD